MKKWLVSDLDGTIIKHNDGKDKIRSILIKDKKAIEDLIRKDAIFIICTGRDKESTFRLFDQENISIGKGYYITSSGSEIYDANRKRIFETILDQETVQQINEFFFNYQNNQALNFEIFDGNQARKILNKSDIVNINRVINICISSKKESTAETNLFYQLAKEQFKNLSIEINQYFVDILPKNISKKSAIQFIIDNYSLNRPIKLYTIGDSWNDISMFEISDLSYTFNNSDDSVKKKATRYVDHLYQAIDEILMD